MTIPEDPFHSYFVAARKVLEGRSMKELESTKLSCTRNYAERYIEHNDSENVGKFPVRGLNPEWVVLSFTADAENRILLGESWEEVYGSIIGGFKLRGPVEGIRERCRDVSEYFLSDYFRHNPE